MIAAVPVPEPVMVIEKLVDVMNEITVSFFSCLSVSSRTRRVPFPRMTREQLNDSIVTAMQASEFYACYHDPYEGVVAVDRDGFEVRV